MGALMVISALNRQCHSPYPDHPISRYVFPLALQFISAAWFDGCRPRQERTGERPASTAMYFDEVLDL